MLRAVVRGSLLLQLKLCFLHLLCLPFSTETVCSIFDKHNEFIITPHMHMMRFSTGKLCLPALHAIALKRGEKNITVKSYEVFDKTDGLEQSLAVCWLRIKQFQSSKHKDKMNHLSFNTLLGSR